MHYFHCNWFRQKFSKVVVHIMSLSVGFNYIEYALWCSSRCNSKFLANCSVTVLDVDEDFLKNAKSLFQNLLKEVHQSTTKYTGRGLIGHFKVILTESFCLTTVTVWLTLFCQSGACHIDNYFLSLYWKQQIIWHLNFITMFDIKRMLYTTIKSQSINVCLWLAA